VRNRQTLDVEVREILATCLGVAGVADHTLIPLARHLAASADEQAAEEVDALQPRVERALRAYELAVAQISGSVSRSVVADQQADETAARALANRREVGNQVRALYMSGGSAALLASVLTSPNATDALRRVAYVQRLVETTTVLADDSAVLAAVAGATVGAKALMIVRDLPDYLAAPSSLFSWSVLSSAGDFYGGFIGALIAAAIFFWRDSRLPFWRTADVCGPAIALGQAIGRVGCFMAGDDYGRPTHVAWAVTFSDPDAARIGGAPLGVALHPVQLYESIICAVLFVVRLRLKRRKHCDGEVILSYTLLYAVARFILEFLRGDADRGFVFGGLLSTSQFIGIVSVVLGIGLFIALLRKYRRDPESLRLWQHVPVKAQAKVETSGGKRRQRG
jgi:phosphatidylglycerol:prolipoprotein diacylglycerol transferase